MDVVARARELPVLLKDALDVSPEEQDRRQVLARLGWREARDQLLVCTTWFLTALALGTLASLAMQATHLVTGSVIMGGAFAGLTAPAAIVAVRRVNSRFSALRMALEPAQLEAHPHQSRPVAEFVAETRVAMASFEGRGIAGHGRQVVWDWLRAWRALPAEARAELELRGLGPGAVRAILLEEEAVRGALTRRQRRRIARWWTAFVDELSRPPAGPYR